MRLISQTNYNEIGQVYQKQLDSKDSVNFRQSIAYTYNERGWLLTSTAALFQMQLEYNTNTISGATISARYNGDIAAQGYGTQAAPNGSYFTYNYDKINRILAGVSSAGFTENHITYDVMGNLSSLYRYTTGGTEIDQLGYSYTLSGNPTNQLQSVADATSNTGGLQPGTTNYTYDGNGNMLSATNTANTQGNKSFTYNLLNLPATSTFYTGSATFAYDAAGAKLRKASTAGTTTTYTDYISGIQYSGTSSESIAFIQTEEGKAVPNGTTNYDYTYYLGDNLGNTRVTFDTKNGYAQSQQVDDYYPFGLEINRTPYTPKNEYLYNRKELQEEFAEYDYGARFYDPVVARWTSVDPDAENDRRWSTYNYVMNNPIRLIDPDGRKWKDSTAANQLLQSAINKELQDNNQIAADQDKINNGGLSDSEKKTLQGKIDELKSNVTSLGDAIQDIVDLGGDQQHTYSLVAGGNGIVNQVHKNDVGEIEIQGDNDAEHIHEISHANVARKFGDLDDPNHWDSDNNLVDHWIQGGGARDETRAYQHQFAFDPLSFGGRGFPRPNSINDINTNYLLRLTHNGEPIYPAVVEAVKEAKAREREPQQRN